MTLDNPNRVPRKVKKKIVKEFGSDIFQEVLSGTIKYKASMSVRFDLGWTYRYNGHTIFIEIR